MEQYLGNDQFDLSLPVAETSPHLTYMADQNSYPSYDSQQARAPVAGGATGESYSELSPMGQHEPPHPPPHSMPQQHPHQQQQQQQQQQQAMYQMGVPGVMHDGNPQFPPQNMYIPPISQQAQMLAAHTSSYMGHPHPSLVYTNAGLGIPHHQAPHAMMPAGPMMQQPIYQYQRPQLPRNSGSPTSGGSPSPGSEDSDDSNAQAQGRGKRPSQDLIAEPIVAKGKKARVSKKSKKKKDPNEPQKPVSAYALFFRDTQAAIKGQNPNASFGEISKIVASMWDSLDPDRKNFYKKKTDAAKKEYLNQLAAYRASLVSKGESDPSMYGGAAGYAQLGGNPGYVYPSAATAGSMPPHPQGHSPPQLTSMAKKPSMLSAMMAPEGNQSLMNPPMSQPMPPSAPGMMPHGPMPGMSQASMAQQMQQGAPHTHPQMIPPHLSQMAPVPASSPYMTQTNPSLSSPVSSLGSDVGSPGHPMHNAPQPAPQQQQPPPVSQQQQQQQPNSTEHQTNTSLAPSGQPQQPGANAASGQSVQTHNGHGACNGGACIRSGCTNPAVHNPEWEDEYCSNECVLSHCRYVFRGWVGTNQQNAQNYPASVK